MDQVIAFVKAQWALANWQNKLFGMVV